MDVCVGLLAYVGPGPGLTMFWAFVGLLSTIGLAVVSILFYPIRSLIRSVRGAPPPSEAATDPAPAAAPDGGDPRP